LKSLILVTADTIELILPSPAGRSLKHFSDGWHIHTVDAKTATLFVYFWTAIQFIARKA
jgi:hypothetical protein